MRVFVYEYVCGGSAEQPVPPSLRREGAAMLAAVVEDLCAARAGLRVEVVTRLDPAVAAARAWPAGLSVRVARPGAEEDEVRELARGAHFTLLIAPEFHDILGTRCQWVEEVGGRLLGPSSAAVRLTTDKLRLAEHLRARGVPTPPTVPCTPEAAALGFPLVVKPRDGAGSQATFLVRDAAELARCPARAAAEGWTGELVAQPFVEGEPASVSFVIGPGGKYCLKPARQLLSADGRLRYEGGVVPGADEKVAKAVAVRALAAVEGLRGWFGVDIVLQEQTGQLIEINPRLTTSYVGLRRLARCNLMELLLAAASGETPPVVAWRDGAVTFRPDGTISEG